jgi:hypothetical protein
MAMPPHSPRPTSEDFPKFCDICPKPARMLRHINLNQGQQPETKMQIEDKSHENQRTLHQVDHKSRRRE